MFENIFINVVNMSITASIIGFILIVLRLILKTKISKAVSYGLWLIVLIRLLVPFSFSSMFSIFNVILIPNITTNNMIQYVPTDIAMMETPVINLGGGIINQQINNLLPPAYPGNSVNPMQIIIYILSHVWVLIGLSMIFVSILKYIRVIDTFNTAILYDDYKLIDKYNKKFKFKRQIGVYTSDRINTPIIWGLINPRIILPLSMTTNNSLELELLIIHGMIHIKRRDYIIKPISLIMLYIHWFNPIMWLSFILANKDMELSCDEEVMIVADKDIRNEYTTTLMNLSTKQNSHLKGGLLVLEEINFKDRIKGMISYKKPNLWIRLISIILIVIVSIATITNPRQDLGLLKIDNTLSVLTQKDRVIAKIGEKDYVIPPHGNFIMLFRNDKWREKKVKSPLELVSEMELELKAGLRIKLYYSEPLAMVLYDGDFRYYNIPKEVYQNLKDYALNYPVGDGNVGKRIDEYLAIITSSPSSLINARKSNINYEQTTVTPIPVSSDPQDYINAHRQEYEIIRKMGVEALEYMRAELKVGEAKGIKAHIMMKLCTDILEDINN